MDMLKKTTLFAFCLTAGLSFPVYAADNDNGIAQIDTTLPPQIGALKPDQTPPLSTDLATAKEPEMPASMKAQMTNTAPGTVVKQVTTQTVVSPMTTVTPTTTVVAPATTVVTPPAVTQTMQPGVKSTTSVTTTDASTGAVINNSTTTVQGSGTTTSTNIQPQPMTVPAN
jgi:hypothetical protein